MFPHRWRSVVIALLFCTLLAPLAAAPAAPHTPVPLIGVSSPEMPSVPVTLAASGYRFDAMQFATVLWADGRGDVTISLELTNLSIPNWQALAWSFGWPSGAYSQIRAQDSSGPLQVETERFGSVITVKPQFRKPVPVGSRYALSFAITIGGMAGGSDTTWRARWSTRSGSAVGVYTERLTVPSNAFVDSFSPENAERQGNQFVWRIVDAAPGWSFGPDVAYTLRDRIPVQLFLQRDEQWRRDPYGSYPDNDTVNTVGYWGCYTTAAAMIARYHADQQGVQAVINPKDLNAWLRTNKRYDGNNFNPLALPDYARSRGVVLSSRRVLTGGRTRDNDRLLDDYLRSGNPVILEVDSVLSPSGIHFVVAVGRVNQNGVDTYTILDPYYGETTLAALYKNTYRAIVPFAGSAADARAISFSGHSPIELLVTDPLGRRSGRDPRTGTRYDEIPQALYEAVEIAPAGDGPTHAFKNLTIYEPVDGPYHVEVIGTGAGPFTLVTLSSDWRGETTLRTEAGEATNGSVARILVAYNAVGGLYPNVVFLPMLRR
jgi:hypothetical protein